MYKQRKREICFHYLKAIPTKPKNDKTVIKGTKSLKGDLRLKAVEIWSQNYTLHKSDLLMNIGIKLKVVFVENAILFLFAAYIYKALDVNSILL